jgi:phosphoenolpyruvate synthase/pyruvate phosphate dikinase
MKPSIDRNHPGEFSILSHKDIRKDEQTKHSQAKELLIPNMFEHISSSQDFQKLHTQMKGSEFATNDWAQYTIGRSRWNATKDNTTEWKYD